MKLGVCWRNSSSVFLAIAVERLRNIGWQLREQVGQSYIVSKSLYQIHASYGLGEE